MFTGLKCTKGNKGKPFPLVSLKGCREKVAGIRASYVGSTRLAWRRNATFRRQSVWYPTPRLGDDRGLPRAVMPRAVIDAPLAHS